MASRRFGKLKRCFAGNLLWSAALSADLAGTDPTC